MREIIEIIVAGISVIIGVIGFIGGIIATRIWFITIFILSILKLTNTLVIPWFGTVTVLSAIGTGLWLLVLGVACILISLIFVAISSVILNK